MTKNRKIILIMCSIVMLLGFLSLFLLKSHSQVDINNATRQELMQVPYIKDAMSEKIIEYREVNNGFKNKEELINVSGIGKTNYNKIQKYLRCDSYDKNTGN